MFTTRSALTACLSMSQHSLMKSRCVLASCKAELLQALGGLLEAQNTFLSVKRLVHGKTVRTPFELLKKKQHFSWKHIFPHRSQGDFCALRCKKRDKRSSEDAEGQKVLLCSDVVCQKQDLGNDKKYHEVKAKTIQNGHCHVRIKK